MTFIWNQCAPKAGFGDVQQFTLRYWSHRETFPGEHHWMLWDGTKLLRLAESASSNVQNWAISPLYTAYSRTSDRCWSSPMLTGRYGWERVVSTPVSWSEVYRKVESFKFNQSSCLLKKKQYFTHKNMDKAKLCLVGNEKINVKWIVLSLSNSLVIIALTGILSRIFFTQWRKLELILPTHSDVLAG